MEYRAITKADPDTELTHFKYVKREKKGDGWKYYYDEESKGGGGSHGRTDVNTMSGSGRRGRATASNNSSPIKTAATAVGRLKRTIDSGINNTGSTIGNNTKKIASTVGNNVKNTGSTVGNNVKKVTSVVENDAKNAVSAVTKKVGSDLRNKNQEIAKNNPVAKASYKITKNTIDTAQKVGADVGKEVNRFKQATAAGKRAYERVKNKEKLEKMNLNKDYTVEEQNIFEKGINKIKDLLGINAYEHMQTMQKNADKANREVSNANSAKAHAETKYRQALDNQASNLGEKDSSINNTQSQQSNARKVESAAKVYSQSIERGQKALVSATMRNAMAEKAAAEYDKTLHAKVSKAKKAVNDFFDKIGSIDDKIEDKIEDSKEKSREKKELKSAYKEAEDKLKQLEKDVKDAERAFNISVGNPDYSEKDVRDFDKWLSNAKTLRDQAQTEYEAAKKAYKDYDK